MAATMKDIAQETGLSMATISKFYNGGNVRSRTRKLIEDAASRINYVPNELARGLKTHRSRTIGVVIPELGNAFITSIITTMEDILRQRNYAVIVCDCRSDLQREKEAVAFLMRKQVDGLINMPMTMDGSHLQPALNAGIPVVLVDRMIDSLQGQVCAVVVDNEAAAEQATRFLLSQGHREIGIVLGSEGLYTTEKRLSGYLRTLHAWGIEPAEEWIRYGCYTLDGGYEAVRTLLQLKRRPSALFVTNFEMTLGALLALNEAGLRMPEDISVIGFDKLDMFGAVFSHLTLVKQPQNAIGEQIARLMLDWMDRGDAMPKQIVTLSTQLVKGSSTRSSDEA